MLKVPLLSIVEYKNLQMIMNSHPIKQDEYSSLPSPTYTHPKQHTPKYIRTYLSLPSFTSILTEPCQISRSPEADDDNDGEEEASEDEEHSYPR